MSQRAHHAIDIHSHYFPQSFLDLIEKHGPGHGFEYRIVEVLPDTTNMQTKLNEFGMNGWELVSVSMGNMTEPRLIFKR